MAEQEKSTDKALLFSAAAGFSDCSDDASVAFAETVNGHVPHVSEVVETSVITWIV